ncbi:MAG: membrane protein insertion efficiency factor YidD [Pseudomonadota bacterium]
MSEDSRPPCACCSPPRPAWRGPVIEGPIGRLLALPIRAYRLLASPWVGMHCRFQPTCSEYALEALARHPPLRATGLILRRLARCRPGGASGYDPVPGDKRKP